jgi:hypothetical protein
MTQNEPATPERMRVMRFVYPDETEAQHTQRLTETPAHKLADVDAYYATVLVPLKHDLDKDLADRENSRLAALDNRRKAFIGHIGQTVAAAEASVRAASAFLMAREQLAASAARIGGTSELATIAACSALTAATRPIDQAILESLKTGLGQVLHAIPNYQAQMTGRPSATLLTLLEDEA